MMKRIFVFIALSIIALSCKTTSPPCINEYNAGMTITWGDFDTKTKKIEGYRLDDAGILYYIKSDSLPNTFITDKLTKTDADEYCKLINFSNSVTRQTQALYAPGEQSKFIDLNVPNTQVFTRAVWNPKFETVGSRRHRLLYDSLMKIVPQEHFLYNKVYKSSYNSND